MNTIKDFNEVVDRLKAAGICRRVAVVSPRDKATIKAVRQAAQEGFIDPVTLDDDNPKLAAEKAVSLAQNGEVDMIMKGLVPSEILLKAIIRYKGGLLPDGNMLTHTACASFSEYHKLLFYTDAAVIPFPTHEQRVRQVGYMAALCHAMGIEEPHISLIHCSEEVDERHFPYTAGYREIVQMAKQGQFGKCVVDGPLDLKTSCSAESLKVKGIVSPINGEADALIFPNIESGNVFHKTITLFNGAKLASLLQGARVPVVMTSRADAPETKYYSLAIAAALGTVNE
ncbi:phosphate acyltransferase [Hallella colorans]|uniref:phosphate acyltransferase n=1 Tax=Hallella colorans TaxID=1703337 RepID=UPI0023F09619|nr:phosphate acyltransferase [Hallella colorans]